MKKEFSPQVSPQEMLELGIFGGWYFKGDIDEYPETWLPIQSESIFYLNDTICKLVRYANYKVIF